MLSLNPDTQASICSELTLTDLQQMSLTCQAFNYLINYSDSLSKQIKKSSFSKTDLKILNSNFVLSHDFLFSNEQLIELDYSRLTLKKLWGIGETNTNVTLLRKLRFIASIYLMKEVSDEWGAIFDPTNEEDYILDLRDYGIETHSIEIHYAQRPYQYLINLLGSSSLVKFNRLLQYDKYCTAAAWFASLQLEDLSTFIEKQEMKIALKNVEAFSTRMDINKNINKKWNHASLQIAYTYAFLKIHNRDELISILSAFWKKHQIYHFVPQFRKSELTYFLLPPSEFFEALCDVLSTTQKQSLGNWSGIMLADEQLQSLLKILPERKINKLKIFFACEVEPETMQALSNLICSDSFIHNNKDSELYFRTVGIAYTQENFYCSDEKKEIKIFKEMLAKFPALSPNWSGQSD